MTHKHRQTNNLIYSRKLIKKEQFWKAQITDRNFLVTQLYFHIDFKCMWHAEWNKHMSADLWLTLDVIGQSLSLQSWHGKAFRSISFFMISVLINIFFTEY